MTDHELVRRLLDAVGPILREVPRPEGQVILLEVEECPCDDPECDNELLLSLGVRMGSSGHIEPVPDALRSMEEVLVNTVGEWN